MNDSQADASNQNLDPEITLGVLNAVEMNDGVTQRSMANDLGIALGLANAYLKRCVKKGWIKVTQAPANRYLYYLTPQGFMEKGRLTAEFLSVSFNFFRKARSECTELFDACAQRQWNRIVLYGKSDLAEIAILSSGEMAIEIIGIVDSRPDCSSYLGLKIFPDLTSAGPVDAVIVTDFSDPQARFDELSLDIPVERILTPRFMHVSRVKPSLAE